jgi:hypothetical protein
MKSSRLLILCALAIGWIACELPEPPITPPKSSYMVVRTKVAVNGESEITDVARAKADVFTIEGLHPLVGRFFTKEEYRSGSVPVAVLSHGYWMDRFRGDPAVIGSNVLVDEERAVIVGVAHPRLRPADAVSVWIPARAGQE